MSWWVSVGSPLLASGPKKASPVMGVEPKVVHSYTLPIKFGPMTSISRSQSQAQSPEPRCPQPQS